MPKIKKFLPKFKKLPTESSPLPPIALAEQRTNFVVRRGVKFA